MEKETVSASTNSPLFAQEFAEQFNGGEVIDIGFKGVVSRRDGVTVVLKIRQKNFDIGKSEALIPTFSFPDGYFLSYA